MKQFTLKELGEQTLTLKEVNHVLLRFLLNGKLEKGQKSLIYQELYKIITER